MARRVQEGNTMVATHNQQTSSEARTLNVVSDASALHGKNLALPAQLLLPNRIITHSHKAGLNPLVDAASHLFSILGKLKCLTAYRHVNKLQKELIQEINNFQTTIKQGYKAEYLIVCRYILCATFDDILANTSWGSQQWESVSLLSAFSQDTQHQDKFVTILERSIKDPATYIDLMELMYICLSMGYKGQYRATEHSQYQLEQITNNLYKHIRAYRGNFSKLLSPTPLKAHKSHGKAASRKKVSPFFILFITVCILMAIFAGLGYLMDVISNEAYKNITQIQTTLPHQTS
jgi:type VI secretion system protein ImpK